MAFIQVNFFSEVLGMSTQMDVILPQETEGQIGVGYVGERKKYPVLYLLHGMTDNETTWQRNTSIERYAAERGIAVVMPTTHLGWYTDMKVGFRYFTHIAKEVPEICQRFFPQISDKKEDTFVAGNSMGGYGAFKLALCAPERFGAAASLSGGLDVAATVKKDGGDFPASFWADIFGPADEVAGSGNDLFAVSENLIKSGADVPKLYMWCGVDDFLYDQNIKMRDHLNKTGYDLTYKETDGDHSWKYWDREIPFILDWFLASREEGK